MTRQRTKPEKEPRSESRTKYLHVEVPEELFVRAKICALESQMTWTNYICSILATATRETTIPNSQGPVR
jgi:hypothetical protein